MTPTPPTQPQTLTLIKKGHYHMFRYFPGEELDIVRSMMEKAEDQTCALDWFDVAILSHQMGPEIAKKMHQLLAAKIGSGGFNKKMPLRPPALPD